MLNNAMIGEKKSTESTLNSPSSEVVILKEFLSKQSIYWSMTFGWKKTIYIKVKTLMVPS